MPKALAVVDAKRKDNQYPFNSLAGVGVVFKLIQAISQKLNLEEKEYLKYESVIKSLINIELLNNKNTFENLGSVLNGINEGYNISELFDCIQCIGYFNQSLDNNDIETARIYLEIICFINNEEKEKTFSYAQIEELKMRLIECEKSNNRQKFLTLN